VANERGLDVVVDYAHTPDALLKALQALRPLTAGRLITVFGCGGDRDRGKRPEMGRVAGQWSDLAVLTSDNPRTEEPAAIIRQIEPGVREAGMRALSGKPRDIQGGRGYLIEPDRAAAIFLAVGIARPGDFVLIAGKGHEDYQIVGEEKRPFDNRREAAAAAAEVR
jgi:UDP-N-acetylmuramoyl-L-alanyl-D-glutamate--2,6-diaminopimelate ligase